MSKQPIIAAELNDLPHVPITALEPLQGNLKELDATNYDKLKRSLLKHGIIVPFFVWLETGKLIDGHQRQRVMLNEDWLIDVPVVYISADNETEAKSKLLVISSQYGRATQEGWDEFTWDVPDAVEIAHFDALPFVFGNIDDINIPDPKDQEEPELLSDHLITIYCSADALAMINDTLVEWASFDDIEVNVS